MKIKMGTEHGDALFRYCGKVTILISMKEVEMRGLRIHMRSTRPAAAMVTAPTHGTDGCILHVAFVQSSHHIATDRQGR